MQKLPKIDREHFLFTGLPYHGAALSATQRVHSLLQVCKTLHKEFEDRRKPKTDRMLESWGLYLNTEEASAWLRRQAMASVGDTTKDWRHRIQSGLAFRTVETVVSYLMGATFPNDDWFDLSPMEYIDDEDYRTYLKVMKHYIKAKLNQSGFNEATEGFLRQLCIAGTSVYALPWRYETAKRKKNVITRVMDEDVVEVVEVEKTVFNAPDLEVADIFDFWLDPDASDPNKADFVRRITMTRAELQRLVKEGYYDLADEDLLKTAKVNRSFTVFSEEKHNLDVFSGIEQSISPSQRVEVYEFWGNLELPDMELHDVVVTWTGDTILRCETNPYWGGRPFVFGTYTPVFNQPYGIGLLEPIRGALQEQASIKNQRLDAGELSLAPMYEFINDGTLDADNFTVEPGKLIPVSALGQTIRPLPFDRNYQGISVSEEQLLVQEIEQTTSTGAFIGNAPGRSGERVTAAEIQAMRDAGGNRLSGVHSHFEVQVLQRLLTRYYSLCQQFQIEEEIVPVPGDSPETIWYVRVGIEQLAHNFYFQPKGASHVADKEYELRNITDWIAAVNQVPEMGSVVNWEEVAKELTRRFIGRDVERFIKSPEEAPPAPEMPIDPEMEAMAQIQGDIQNIGGESLMNALAARESAAPGMTVQGLSASMPSAPPPPGVDVTALDPTMMEETL
jgi:hypothetical protein